MKMALTFDQQLRILSNGCETVVHECELTKIIHYHFVGAPFIGLVSHDIQKKRDEEKIARNLVKHPKSNKIPLKISFNDEEGWKMVYELAELSIAETYVVEQVIKKQRIFLTTRVQSDDIFNPHPFIANLEKELAFGEESCRVSQELAKHRNKLIHALNGNIRQVGDTYVHDGNICEWTEETIKRLTLQQYNACFGESKEKVDFVSLVNELDMFENKKLTFNFEMTTTTTGLVSVMIREEKVFGTGKGSNKKKVKANACENLLRKLLSTYYFNFILPLDLKFQNIFSKIPRMQSAIKEDTKRDSKTRKHDNSKRSILLQNKGLIEEARKQSAFEKYNKLQKIYAIQRKQEKVKTDAVIAQRQTLYSNRDNANQQWKIPVDGRLGDFQEL
jgi:hypothetical protein